MALRNQEIKNYAKEKNVFLWEIAEKFGVSDSNFSRRLRKEFSAHEKEKAIRYINEIAESRELE